MTHHARLLILVLLSTLALGAATAASASASEFIIEGKQVTEATNVEGTSGLALLAGVIGGVEVKIECVKDTFTGTIETGGKGSATLLLKECSETKPVNCKVPATIEGKLKSKLIGSATPEMEFEATTAEGAISEIVISGAGCAIPGTYALKGSQICELPKAEEEAVEHEAVCKKLKSKLKLGPEAASFSNTEKAKLTSGKKWSDTSLTAGKPLSVDYRGNQLVLVDHLKNISYGELEKSLSIKQYGALNEVEWEADHTGAIKKIWIPTYVLGKKVELEAQFSVEAATREYLEKNAQEVELKGETTVAGGSFSFTKTLKSALIKEQFEKHAGYLTTEVVGASAALVSKVTSSLSTITWKWTVKEAGRTIVQELGKNSNTFYLIYRAPVGNSLIYFTLLDLATQGVKNEGEPLTEKKVIAGVWSGFKNRQTEGPCQTLECAITRIRTFNPATGEITRNGNQLLYYEQLLPNLNLREYYFSRRGSAVAGGRYKVWLLLEALTGECGSWARAFKSALGTEGISALQLKIYPKFPSSPAGLPCQSHGACIFLVANWGFTGSGTSLSSSFPYLWTEVKDENGSSGQGVENPSSVFQNHELIEVENKLYDPSYGTEPVGAGNTGETALNLKLYQEKNIKGFCAVVGSEFNCAKPVAGRQGLEAFMEPEGSTESEESEEPQELGEV
jgi:hypothetical protein